MLSFKEYKKAVEESFGGLPQRYDLTGLKKVFPELLDKKRRKKYLIGKTPAQVQQEKAKKKVSVKRDGEVIVNEARNFTVVNKFGGVKYKNIHRGYVQPGVGHSHPESRSYSQDFPIVSQLKNLAVGAAKQTVKGAGKLIKGAVKGAGSAVKSFGGYIQQKQAEKKKEEIRQTKEKIGQYKEAQKDLKKIKISQMKSAQKETNIPKDFKTREEILKSKESHQTYPEEPQTQQSQEEPKKPINAPEAPKAPETPETPTTTHPSNTPKAPETPKSETSADPQRKKDNLENVRRRLGQIQ